MFKRIFDFVFSLSALVLLLPLFLNIILIIFFQDFSNPLYISKRVGKGGDEFSFYKFRSMRINSDSSGVDSTSTNDSRITPIGNFIRRYKIDELSQLLNVLIGNMSLVGPRPNVKRDTDIYTVQEKKLLSVKPGITDFSSIVFSDEGDILEGHSDPDLAYNQLIRPWKSRLGLLYIDNRSFLIELKLIYITVISLFSRKSALLSLCGLLRLIGAAEPVIEIASRKKDFVPYPPPGSEDIVRSRELN